MSAKQTSGGGISFPALLAILFIGLKLTGFIDWSWVWVLSPLWIPFAIVLLVVVVVVIVAIAASLGIVKFTIRRDDTI